MPAADPKPPAGLSAAGRSQWRRILADVAEGWRLDARDLHLLEGSCRAVDRAAELEAIVAAEGIMVAGSKGQMRVHPGAVEARMQRQLAAQLLSKVELEPPRERTGHLNRRQRGRLRDIQRGVS